ncbi:MAG: hypothetical protein ACTSRI_12350, partial [Promethearchaeota archaeon]
VFIGVIPPSKAFPELTVEERGHIIPFFNAKIFALYNKNGGISFHFLTQKYLHFTIRWVHNWRRKKRFFCRVIFIIFSRENPNIK